jgi:hypothetical protein
MDSWVRVLNEMLEAMSKAYEIASSETTAYPEAKQKLAAIARILGEHVGWAIEDAKKTQAQG